MLACVDWRHVPWALLFPATHVCSVGSAVSGHPGATAAAGEQASGRHLTGGATTYRLN